MWLHCSNFVSSNFIMPDLLGQEMHWCVLLWDFITMRHNEHDGVSNHQPHHCLLNSLFGCRSKKTSKLRVTGHCAGNSPGTGEIPAEMASNAEYASIWRRYHAIMPDLHRQEMHSGVLLCNFSRYIKYSSIQPQPELKICACPMTSQRDIGLQDVLNSLCSGRRVNILKGIYLTDDCCNYALCIFSEIVLGWVSRIRSQHMFR